jgi:hypothetical protein
MCRLSANLEFLATYLSPVHGVLYVLHVLRIPHRDTRKIPLLNLRPENITILKLILETWNGYVMYGYIKFTHRGSPALKVYTVH